MKHCLYTLLASFFMLVKISAQAPVVTSVYPGGGTVTAPADAVIKVVFAAPLDPLTVTPQTFRVFGRWSGPAAGTLTFHDGNKEVQFQPAEPFFAGEGVGIQLSRGIAGADGTALQKPFAWGYWIATAPGILNQPLKETIELRLPGETYLQTYGAYAGDMNNDGYSDLVAVNESSDDLRILLNDGQGGYPDFTVYDTGDNATPSPSEGADFNNDGEIDLVVTTAWNTQVRVLTGDGLGNFSNMKTYFTHNGVRGVVVGDFNGDGWDDMLTTNRLAGNSTIFMNNGDGLFTASDFDVPNQDETACALADINGDGVLDIYYAAYNSQKVGVLIGDGEGNFTPGASVSVQGRPWMIASGDLDGDGFPDVVSVNSNSNRTAVLFGDGQGGLSNPTHLTAPQHTFPLAIDLGDLDGDGDLDLVTSNYAARTYTVFENNGSGQFTAPVTLLAPEASSCAILHDRDKDGDLDITGTDEEADVILLFENPGAPNATWESPSPDMLLTVVPNPSNGGFRVNYELPAASEVAFFLTDVSGKVIWETTAASQQPGLHTRTIELNDLLSGVYFLEIQIRQPGASQITSSKRAKILVTE